MYDPFEDLLHRTGYTVGVTPDLPASDAWLICEDRTILLNEALDPAQRRTMCAHMLAHVDLGHPAHLASADHTVCHEVEAQRLAARRLIELPDLSWALAHVGAEADLIAQQLGVTVSLLAKRVRHLVADEAQALMSIGRRIIWPSTPAAPPLRCTVIRSLPPRPPLHTYN
ncbi:ImmA/IrrE family metallo-endopeptidase [Nocardia testacea]|uniref:ImmA/IrrE family metallo-endopeptidase n=1 Tax=Nocardia testacea TaxID=248551 RepID=UPI0012F64AFB|nr:ImmA/IrrE family metallo-endopeptidase [Nocardia testacea]